MGYPYTYSENAYTYFHSFVKSSMRGRIDTYMKFVSLEMINIILLAVIVLLGVVIILIVFNFVLKKKDPNKTLQELNKKLDTDESNILSTHKSKKKKSKKESKEVQDPNIKPGITLLNFDRICDDMIINDNASNYAMVIRCRGINFDLMSEEEKTDVEKNFIDFLNNIQYPMQFFVQTRVVNLSSNVSVYSQRQTHFENELKSMVDQFNQLKSNPEENRTHVSLLARKILKKQRLFEYIKDIHHQIEKVVKNNSVIQKEYYVILRCTAEEAGINPKQPDLNTVCNELSGRCKSIINNLQKCGIEASILNSYQLCQLFYYAFNQDDENMLKLQEAMGAGFLKLYSSPR